MHVTTKSMSARLQKLTAVQAVLIITIVGFAVYFSGLFNQFQGDDSLQIVLNVPVHSISHIRLFFEGGTFYDGQGLAPLVGLYYRPLMTVVFSLLYTVFGAQPFYFHLLQLLLAIGSSSLLYLVFRYSFKPVLALSLALIFLIHPLDSQIVFAIPSMQDALFFFFGILAVWLLLRYDSRKSLGLVGASLFLALLAKETAILFVLICGLYLFWWHKKRLLPFIGSMVLEIALWLVLKAHAVGLNAHPDNAPIAKLNLGGRLLTDPSIVLLYITKFIFPWKLASAYYWVDSSFSIRHVLVPLIIDVFVLALIVYVTLVIRRRASRAMYYSYLFFGIWALLGLLTTLQIIPIDMTASEPWIYLSMAGGLGMIGVVISVLAPSVRLDRRLVYGVFTMVIVLLGIRTALRGPDWKNSYTIAACDVSVTQDAFTADDAVAIYDFNSGNYPQAKIYASRAVAIFPTAEDEATLGGVLATQGNYPAAYQAFNNGLKYTQYYVLYNDLATLTLYYGSPAANQQLLIRGLRIFPHDSALWYYLALLEERNNDNADAVVAIENAARFGQVSSSDYTNILNDRPFVIMLGASRKTLQIP